MTGRIIYWSVLLAVAVMTLFAQLDRSARFSPQMAAFVPASFSGFAAERRAERAVLTRDGVDALSASKALVAVRPAPAEHLSLLAQSYAFAGDTRAALAALEAASGRGWRDPVVQLAAAQAALAGAKPQAAAQRISALLATNALPDQSDDLVAQLLGTPAGRAAFAERLAGDGRWQAGWTARAISTLPPEQLLQTLLLAEAAGAQIPCAQFTAIAAKLSAGAVTQQPDLPARCR